MQYVYAAVWFALGLVLIFFMGRKSKLYVFSSGIFFLMGVWWLLQAIFPEAEILRGWLNWVVKALLGVCLLVLCAVFFWQRRSGKEP